MSRKSNLDGLIRQSALHRQEHGGMFLLVCIPAVMFAVIGLLFAANFGVALILIAIAILYYSRYGQKIAAQLGAMLLLMLAIWMTLMPAHHLVAASLGILLLALAGQYFGPRQGRRQIFRFFKIGHLLEAPAYAWVAIREKFSHDPGFDAR